MARHVRNEVKLAGRIAYIWFGDNRATIVVDTGTSGDGIHNNKPSTVAFDKVLDVARQYSVGDHVLLEATMQENKKAEGGLSRRTIAVNRIIKLDPNNPKYHTQNFFGLSGWIVNIRRYGRQARAIIKVNANGHQNYIAAYFKPDAPDVLDDFCSLDRTTRVRLSGYIRTNRVLSKDGTVRYYDRLMVDRYVRVD